MDHTDTARAEPDALGRRTRLLTWVSVLGAAVGVACIAFGVRPVWVPILAALAGLVAAIAARRSGLRQRAAFDGRLSLAAAIVAILSLIFLLPPALLVVAGSGS